jgi:putative ATP-binding cassette transporter
MELLNLLRRESRIHPRFLILLTVVSALATVVVIATVSMAAEMASHGRVSLRLAGIFLVATMLYALVQNALMASFATEVEGIIHRIRQSLFDAIRKSDLPTLDRIQRTPMFAAITRDTQTISRNLPLLIIGLQQLVLVVFIALYLSTLSQMAFVLATAFSIAAVGVHLARMRMLGLATDRAQADESRLFDGLGSLLHGLKEVRLSAAHALALRQDLAAYSSEARRAKAGLKDHWGREFALIQLAFYVLVGLMVFVVPMFTADFHAVVLPGTMAALFLIGPIGTVATAIPAIDDAERALLSIRDIQSRLQTALAQRADESSEPLTGPVSGFSLEGIRFSYDNRNGDPGFSVGPLSARFQAGQITFITGGNGSGKSTMMKLLTGLLPAQGGELKVDGIALRRSQLQAWRDSISAVFADYHLFARLYGVDAKALERMPDLLRRLEMQNKVSFVDGAFSSVDLSAGQRKRLALIGALLEEKPVLVLDEWAADQDPHFRKVFYEEILPQLRAEGKVVICVTHDDRWFGVADQILHMSEGRLEPATEHGISGTGGTNGTNGLGSNH